MSVDTIYHKFLTGNQIWFSYQKQHPKVIYKKIIVYESESKFAFSGKLDKIRKNLIYHSYI